MSYHLLNDVKKPYKINDEKCLRNIEIITNDIKWQCLSKNDSERKTLPVIFVSKDVAVF